MADKIPLKANYTGADVTSLGEFAAGDTTPVASGGTGATTAADARTNLGAAALAGSASQSFSMLNGTVAGNFVIQNDTRLGYKITASAAGLLSTNWYRIAILDATNIPNTVELLVSSDARHQNVIINLYKGTGHYTVEVYEGGRYAYPQNIKNVRIVDMGTNAPIYVDVQIGADDTTGTWTVLADHRGAAAALTLCAFVDQGTTAAGHVYPVTSVIRSFGDGVSAGPVLTLKEGRAVTIPGTLALTGASSTLGYGTGAGGTVTQATSKSTAVTLNKPCGRITMNNASLAAGGTVFFLLNNTSFGVDDICSAHIYGSSFAGNYEVFAYTNNVGQVGFKVRNISAGALAENVGISFAIIKGATS